MALLILLPLLFVVPWILGTIRGDRVETVPYSFFVRQIDDGNVASITVRGERVSGVLQSEQTYRTNDGNEQNVTEFITYLPATVEAAYLESLSDGDVRVTTLPTRDNSGWAILLNLLPILLLIWIFVRFQRANRQQGGGGLGGGLFNMGQNRAKKFVKDESSITFDDVAGADSAKAELAEVVDFLQHSQRYEKIGAETPHGLLLVGPPGSGKTLLAKAVAGEADVPFYSISGSDFIEMFVGVGASRVRNLFSEARKNSPAIVFIDELDSIGRQRGAGLGGGHDEREQTLNQMLSEMDGFETHESVIVLAATNRPDVLDPALLRPGRFDRRVTVPAPAVGDREKILSIHLKKRPTDGEIDIPEVAKTTPGFSGADLANVVNEAALLAVRDDRTAVRHNDLIAARDKITLGLERSGVVMTEEERKTVAFHEAGHALVASKLPTAEPVHRITIIPRERAMGVTQQLPEGDRYLYREDYVRDRLAVMMGGRAAEQHVFDAVTSGAENDLKEAHSLARRMVLDWGMGDTLRNTAFGSDSREVFLGNDIGKQNDFSDSSAEKIDEEIRGILKRAWDRAVSVIEEHSASLSTIADTLLEKEEIDRQQLEALIAQA